MSDIPIAIVGAGYMAEEHIKALQFIGGCTIVGITSRTVKKARGLAKKYNIPVVATNIKELHCNTDAVGVVIAVNELSTTTILAEAMEFNWQILCEKPIGLYPSDAKLLEQMHQTGIHAYLLRSIDDFTVPLRQQKPNLRGMMEIVS